MTKPSPSVVRRVAALGFTPVKIRRYVAAMQKTPSGRSAGPTGESARYQGIDFSPPSDVREAAVEALEWRFRDGHKGGTDIGVGRALQLALEDAIPPRDIRRMVAYGTRHAVDLRSAGARRGALTPGVVAWGLWGGTEGIAWARQVRAQMDARDAEGPRRRQNVGGREYMPPGWKEEYANHLNRVAQARKITVTAAAMERGKPFERLHAMGLVAIKGLWTADEMLFATDTVDLEITKRGMAAYHLRQKQMEEAERARATTAQRSLFGNPAPGYQSWAWTTQDWRVVVPHADGSVSYEEACGGAHNRTHAGHVRLCLPAAVARALDGDAEGRRILYAQAVKKQRAKPGARIAWHPVIRELWRRLEARTEADDPRLRRHR